MAMGGVLEPAMLRAAWLRLGEPAALGTRVALVYLPFGLIGPMLIDRARLGGPVLTWVLIAIAGQAVLMGMLWAGRSALHRRPGRSRPVATLIVLALSVLVRGATIALLAWWLGLSPDLELVYRLGPSILAQFSVLVVFAVVVSSYDNHRRLAGELRVQRARIAMLNVALVESVEAERRALVDRLHAMLAPLTLQLDGAVGRIGDPLERDRAIGSIRQLVDDEVRPLSHRLASGGEALSIPEPADGGALPRIPLPDRLPLGSLIQPAAVALLLLIAAMSQSLRVFPFPQSLEFPVASGIMIAAALWAMRAVVGRAEPALWLGILICTALAATSFTVVLLAQRAIGLAVPDAVGAAGPAVAGVLGLLTSAYIAFNARVQSTEQGLRESIAELELTTSALRQRAFVLRRRMGQLVHGPVQAALHAAAMRLAMAQQPDDALIASIRDDIVSSLAQLEVDTGPDIPLVDTLADIAELWDGTCRVHWTLDHRTVRLLAESPVAAASAAEIARECVTNAIRHGGASEVWLTIQRSGDGVVVTALDNGTGLDLTRGPGLGSRMLDEVCVEWSRESGTQGTRVTAIVPVVR